MDEPKFSLHDTPTLSYASLFNNRQVFPDEPDKQEVNNSRENNDIPSINVSDSYANLHNFNEFNSFHGFRDAHSDENHPDQDSNTLLHANRAISDIERRLSFGSQSSSVVVHGTGTRPDMSAVLQTMRDDPHELDPNELFQERQARILASRSRGWEDEGKREGGRKREGKKERREGNERITDNERTGNERTGNERTTGNETTDRITDNLEKSDQKYQSNLQNQHLSDQHLSEQHLSEQSYHFKQSDLQPLSDQQSQVPVISEVNQEKFNTDFLTHLRSNLIQSDLIPSQTTGTLASPKIASRGVSQRTEAKTTPDMRSSESIEESLRSPTTEGKSRGEREERLRNETSMRSSSNPETLRSNEEKSLIRSISNPEKSKVRSISSPETISSPNQERYPIPNQEIPNQEIPNQEIPNQERYLIPNSERSSVIPPERSSLIRSSTNPERSSLVRSSTIPERSSLIRSSTNPERSSLVRSSTIPERSSLVRSTPNPERSSLVRSTPNPERSSLVRSTPNTSAFTSSTNFSPLQRSVKSPSQRSSIKSTPVMRSSASTPTMRASSSMSPDSRFTSPRVKTREPDIMATFITTEEPESPLMSRNRQVHVFEASSTDDDYDDYNEHFSPVIEYTEADEANELSEEEGDDTFTKESGDDLKMENGESIEKDGENNENDHLGKIDNDHLRKIDNDNDDLEKKNMDNHREIIENIDDHIENIDKDLGTSPSLQAPLEFHQSNPIHLEADPNSRDLDEDDGDDGDVDDGDMDYEDDEDIDDVNSDDYDSCDSFDDPTYDMIPPSPPRSPPRDMEPDKLYGLYDFSGPDPSHCSLVRDEPVYLINDTDNYWWLIRKLTREERTHVHLRRKRSTRKNGIVFGRGEYEEEEEDEGSNDDDEDGKIGFVPAECLETYEERLARLNCFKNEELERTFKEDLEGQDDNFAESDVGTDAGNNEDHHENGHHVVPKKSVTFEGLGDLDMDDDEEEDPVAAIRAHKLQHFGSSYDVDHDEIVRDADDEKHSEVLSDVFPETPLVVRKRDARESPRDLTMEIDSECENPYRRATQEWVPPDPIGERGVDSPQDSIGTFSPDTPPVNRDDDEKVLRRSVILDRLAKMTDDLEQLQMDYGREDSGEDLGGVLEKNKAKGLEEEVLKKQGKGLEEEVLKKQGKGLEEEGLKIQGKSLKDEGLSETEGLKNFNDDKGTESNTMTEGNSRTFEGSSRSPSRLSRSYGELSSDDEPILNVKSPRVRVVLPYSNNWKEKTEREGRQKDIHTEVYNQSHLQSDSQSHLQSGSQSRLQSDNQRQLQSDSQRQLQSESQRQLQSDSQSHLPTDANQGDVESEKDVANKDISSAGAVPNNFREQENLENIPESQHETPQTSLEIPLEHPLSHLENPPYPQENPLYPLDSEISAETVSSPDNTISSPSNVPYPSQSFTNDSTDLFSREVRDYKNSAGDGFGSETAVNISNSSVHDVSNPSIRNVSNPSIRNVSNPSIRNVSNPSIRGISNPSIRGISNPSIRDVSDPTNEYVSFSQPRLSSQKLGTSKSEMEKTSLAQPFASMSQLDDDLMYRFSRENMSDHDDGLTPLTSVNSLNGHTELADKRKLKPVHEMFMPILGKFDELAEKLAELDGML